VRDLLAQIRTASATGLYYVALFPSLSLPDICGAIESLDGGATGPKYMAWFDKWVAPNYAGRLSGQDCYYYRCSLLHQGTTQHPRSTYARIIFVEPTVRGLQMHNNIMNDALNIDVRVFCEDILQGVEAWLPSAEQLSHFAANVAKFITRYPNGLAPYIVGVPVIG